MNISQKGDFKTTEGQVIGVALTSIPDYESVRKSKNIETSRTAEDRVNRQLMLAGVMNPEEKSYCLRAGLAKGFYNFKGRVEDLERVIWRGKCINKKCRESQAATVRMLLDQPDNGADHILHKAKGAVVVCSVCEERMYVTRLCEGRPEKDTGKFHHHCKDCGGLGICTRNATNAHCRYCHHHFDTGIFQTAQCSCKETVVVCCSVA
ncbi:hypothetical protein NSK_006788 [Nannochloropsis salina CCMP1776]|uniref:Uncharacterized protein n=1 Tax=Nannochloropsis salina CCMP1776 TaxID=1027361 RepID=A0A4D9CRU8_9STRA|nr:hypothetical protein NSK_006788 [Nannochloropsis salina CCMP1776]|eukprot:TFJ81536.1 hypothetical protein NSK_006788 [Nannochloropsis salina CCMP1776]